MKNKPVKKEIKVETKKDVKTKLKLIFQLR